MCIRMYMHIHSLGLDIDLGILSCSLAFFIQLGRPGKNFTLVNWYGACEFSFNTLKRASNLQWHLDKDFPMSAYGLNWSMDTSPPLVESLDMYNQLERV